MELEDYFCPLPRTPTVKTGGGGRHYYFKMPESEDVRNSTKLGKRPVDVRGTGGYVLAAPSNHISGNDYVWEVSPDEVCLAEAPPWLLDIVTREGQLASCERNAL